MAAVRCDARQLEDRLDRGWQRYEQHFADSAIAEQFRQLLAKAHHDWSEIESARDRAGQVK
jgi:hypothetical protein